MPLSVEKVERAFGGVRALDGVTFTVGEGEVHGLIGENGAGKSTFIKILTGAHRAEEGEILLFGERFDVHSPRQADRAGVAAVFQELSLVPDEMR